MTITREIQGKQVSFELTTQELYNAFEEQENKFRMGNVEAYIKEKRSSAGLDGKTFAEPDEIQKEEILSEYSRNIDKYEMSPDYAMPEAYTAVMGNGDG